jgi:hypothetical protein
VIPARSPLSFVVVERALHQVLIVRGR